MSTPERAHHDLSSELQTLLSELQKRVGADAWSRWFEGLDYKLEGDTLVVVAPSGFHSRWVRTNHPEDFEEAVASVYGTHITVDYQVEVPPLIDGEIIPDLPPIPVGPILPDHATDGDPTKRPPPKFLDKYVFDTFIAGSSNQLALAAAKRVSEGPGQDYNPLFIYGGAGLGKTHLLHAIGHYIQTHRPAATTRYMTSENFFNEFVDGIRNKKMDSFKHRYRTIDVLLLDDIQFFEGKEQVLEEIFHTFNTLHELNHQMVLSCDRPPKDLGIEDRLRSRFQWGLITDISPPDLETRLAILRRNASEYSPLPVPDQVLEFIAGYVTDNIRELEGALTRVTAGAALTEQPITLELARSELRDLIPSPANVPPTGQEVLEVTAITFGYSPVDLQGRRRTQPLATHRQIAMYMCRELTRLSLPKIGKLFGGRDHTTILHGIKRIERLIHSDPDIARQVSQVSDKLGKR
ncbi:MAG: chromosomal replication initiator protein DnaA [bacterium]|nr:chromosomal replication initiator protein DnaA [bacterium]